MTFGSHDVNSSIRGPLHHRLRLVMAFSPKQSLDSEISCCKAVIVKLRVWMDV
jgi:hypothetical protein